MSKDKKDKPVWFPIRYNVPEDIQLKPEEEEKVKQIMKDRGMPDWNQQINKSNRYNFYNPLQLLRGIATIKR